MVGDREVLEMTQLSGELASQRGQFVFNPQRNYAQTRILSPWELHPHADHWLGSCMAWASMPVGIFWRLAATDNHRHDDCRSLLTGIHR
jgi:hypothetical protein